MVGVGVGSGARDVGRGARGVGRGAWVMGRVRGERGVGCVARGVCVVCGVGAWCVRGGEGGRALRECGVAGRGRWAWGMDGGVVEQEGSPRRWRCPRGSSAVLRRLSSADLCKWQSELCGAALNVGRARLAAVKGDLRPSLPHKLAYCTSPTSRHRGRRGAFGGVVDSVRCRVASWSGAGRGRGVGHVAWWRGAGARVWCVGRRAWGVGGVCGVGRGVWAAGRGGVARGACAVEVGVWVGVCGWGVVVRGRGGWGGVWRGRGAWGVG